MVLPFLSKPDDEDLLSEELIELQANSVAKTVIEALALISGSNM